MKALMFLILSFLIGLSPARGDVVLRVDPAAVVLISAESRQQLLASAEQNGREWDVTGETRFESSNPAVVIVGMDGVLRPRGDGVAKVTATFERQTVAVEVKVINSQQMPALHFSNDIVPLLTRASCNSGGCHGKQNGQNGFRLSVFGYDPQTDYQALTQEGRGRRVFPAAPGQSLLLTKVTNRVPHGGGKRFDEDSVEYRRLLRWITEGMPRGDDAAPQVTAIEVFPRHRVLHERGQQRLLVTAKLSDGTQRDVTHLSLFRSNEDRLAQVDAEGRITTTMLPGESAIVVRYQELVAFSYVTVPMNRDEGGVTKLADWKQGHFIDRLVAEKWERLQLQPSIAADDATFLRRVFLDLIGKLPTPGEVQAFLTDPTNDKRIRLVNSLLERPEYADYWALRWSDVLRINREELGAKGAYHYHQWLRQAWQQNLPYDEIVRSLLTAQGSSERNGAINFYKAFGNPNDLSVAVSQVFLGVRLECARCHHHPYEKWGQDDFYSLAAFFPRIQKKANSGAVFIADKGEVKHPRTLEVMKPRVLLGEPLDIAVQTDPRALLADWIASPDNKLTARALVNRVWAQLMGRGLVEPVDDLRETNPATNEPLLNALADDFVAHRFNLRHLMRTIVLSRVYGLSSESNQSNVRDTQNYSRTYRKRLSAEVLLDAVCDVTGEPESFPGMPPSTRAVQLWDQRLPSTFLDTFGRPQRKTLCQCERLADATLSQVLHLLNSPLVNDKISSPAGRAALLATSKRSPDAIINELYLAAFGREPRSDELAAAREAFNRRDVGRRQATEDVLWALINSAEFVLNH